MMAMDVSDKAETLKQPLCEVIFFVLAAANPLQGLSVQDMLVSRSWWHSKLQAVGAFCTHWSRSRNSRSR